MGLDLAWGVIGQQGEKFWCHRFVIQTGKNMVC